MSKLSSLHIAFYLMVLLDIFVCIYFIIKRDNYRNIFNTSLICGVFSSLLVLIFFVLYALLYGFSFGAIQSFLGPVIRTLPWIAKGQYAFIFPFLLFPFVFSSIFSTKILIQIFKSKTSELPSRFLAAMSLLLFTASLFIFLKIVSHWISDQKILSQQKTYIKLSSQSNNTDELNYIFQITANSNDPDINDPWLIIPNIAANKNSSPQLLQEINQYAEKQNDDNKKNSILKALATNPSLPKNLLQTFATMPPGSREFSYLSPDKTALALAQNPSTPSQGLKDIANKITSAQVINALAKNPNSTPEVLRIVYLKIPAQITYFLIPFAENKNTPEDIFKNIANRISDRINNQAIELDQTEISLMTSIIYAMLKNPATPLSVIQELTQLHDCNLRQIVFFRLNTLKSYPDILNQMMNEDKDIGNQLYYRSMLNQPHETIDATLFNKSINLAREADARPDVLKRIIDYSISQINHQNYIWQTPLTNAVSNPNISIEELQQLSTYPSCEVRKKIIQNKTTPTSIIEKMTNDGDQSTRNLAKKVLKSRSARL